MLAYLIDSRIASQKNTVLYPTQSLLPPSHVRHHSGEPRPGKQRAWPGLIPKPADCAYNHIRVLSHREAASKRPSIYRENLKTGLWGLHEFRLPEMRATPDLNQKKAHSGYFGI